MSEPLSNTISRVFDLINVVLECVIAAIISAIQNFITSRLRRINLERTKRRILTGLGIVYWTWAFFAISIVIYGAWTTFRNPSLITLDGIATFAGTFVLANLMISLPLFALKFLAKRWDPRHWVFTMATEILSFGQKTAAETTVISRGPSYIQIVRLRFGP
jgi:hypothetical protein